MTAGSAKATKCDTENSLQKSQSSFTESMFFSYFPSSIRCIFREKVDLIVFFRQLAFVKKN